MDCGVPFCHQGCPLGNLIPDWSRPGLPRPVEVGDRAAARDQQLPRVHRQALPGPLRDGLRARPDRRSRSRSSRSRRASSTEPGTKAGSSPSCRRSRPARRSRWSAPAPPAWPSPSNSPGPGTTSSSSSATTGSAACSATASPTSRWRSTTSTAGSPRWRPRAWSSRPAWTSAATSPPSSSSPTSTPSASAPGRPTRATWRSPAETSGASTTRWTTSPRRTSGWPATPIPDEHFITAKDKHVDHHRRRRHRGRLPGDGPPPGGEVGLPVPDPPPAARGPAPRQPLAAVVERPPDQRRPRGRGRPRVFDPHPPVPRRARPGHRPGDDPVRVSARPSDGHRGRFVEIPGTEKVYPADLILLAIGYTGPDRGPLLEDLGVALDDRGNVKADLDRRTNVDKVFVAGDMSRGQSLIVWAIAEGRHAAHTIDKTLMGSTDLPRPLDHGNDRRPFV